jgi:hypothetical protein
LTLKREPALDTSPDPRVWFVIVVNRRAPPRPAGGVIDIGGFRFAPFNESGMIAGVIEL